MRNKNQKRWQWRDKEQDTQHLNSKTCQIYHNKTENNEKKKIDAKTETQNHQNETKGNQTQEVRKKMNRKTKKAQSNNNKKDTKSPKHEKDDNEETQNET